jgi:hypothetical protein
MCAQVCDPNCAAQAHRAVVTDHHVPSPGESAEVHQMVRMHQLFLHRYEQVGPPAQCAGARFSECGKSGAHRVGTVVRERMHGELKLCDERAGRYSVEAN